MSGLQRSLLATWLQKAAILSSTFLTASWTKTSRNFTSHLHTYGAFDNEEDVLFSNHAVAIIEMMGDVLA